jgi:WD40-like Beta Propeller Repeat
VFERLVARAVDSTKARRGRLVGLTLFAVLASLAFAVPAAFAEPPAAKITSVAPLYNTAEGTGEIDPVNSPTDYSWEVSTDGENWQNAYASSINPEFEPGPPGFRKISNGLFFLHENTHYEVRITATNQETGESSVSPISEFTTKPVPAPTVTINPVSSITGKTAHFSGKIDPGAANSNDSFDVYWRFECLPTCPGFANERSGGEFDDDGNEHLVDVDAEIEPNTHYTIKLVAENACYLVPCNNSVVAETTFDSPALEPTVETLPAYALQNGTEALLGGRVNPNNMETKYWVEYGPGQGGPGASYPSSFPVDHDQASAGAAGQAVFSVRQVSGLDPGSSYHYRIAAKNAVGTSFGEDVAFETAPGPESLSCPNEKLRTETSSTQLSECRAYEMVSPPWKNGGVAEVALAVSPDGNRVGYTSQAGFGDVKTSSLANTYLAVRGSEGWSTHPMNRANTYPNIGSGNWEYGMDFLPDLSAALQPRRNDPTEKGKWNVYKIGADGSQVRISSPSIPTDPETNPAADKAYSGRSADASHVLFDSKQNFTAQGNGQRQVWEWVDGTVRLVSILPDAEGGGPAPGGACVGTGVNAKQYEGLADNAGRTGRLPEESAVSEDGSRIFFTVKAPLSPWCIGESKGLYVREDGVVSRRLDLSQRAGSEGDPPLDPGVFLGAAADGSVVLFRSSDRLTDDATANGGLYAYDLEDDELRFVSAGATFSEGARFQEAVISPDGSRIYFTARSVLIPGEGREGQDNVYLYDSDGLHFIATASFEFQRTFSPPNVQMTEDGGQFVFTTAARLSTFDNDGHFEIYRYSASSETITCVSCTGDGHPAAGAASMWRVDREPVGNNSVLSEDGSAVLFESSDALLPADVNGRWDVYLYRAGRLSLISTGTSSVNSSAGGLSSDGSNAIVLTNQSLVGQDIDDGATDVYDARVNGGFPAPALANPCETADACQHPPPPPPEMLAPATTAPGRGNPQPKKAKKPCKHAKKKRAKCGRKHKGRKHKAGSRTHRRHDSSKTRRTH